MEKRKSKKGQINQKMVCFRLDNENAWWLECHDNKGRYINRLIQEDRLKRPDLADLCKETGYILKENNTIK